VLAAEGNTDLYTAFPRHPGTVVPSQPLHPGPLLIVDDRVEVRSALERFFGLWFRRVYAVATASEADSILERHRPSVLLCDYYLGDDLPPGTELIAGWRKRFPCLQRVVLMTGTRVSSLGDVSCVDAVFQKPLNLRVVTPFLLGETDQVPEQ
jgi:CheY-like chemotaxis protein